MTIQKILVRVIAGFLATFFCSIFAYAQIPSDVDPNLVEVVQIIKKRASEPKDVNLLRNNSNFAKGFNSDSEFFTTLNEVLTSTVAENPDGIRLAVRKFKKVENAHLDVDIEEIAELYNVYADALEKNFNLEEIENTLSPYQGADNWFQKFLTHQLTAFSYANMKRYENHKALQNAQDALSVIPNEESELPNYARIEITSLIAQLHNLKANKELAISTTQEYLKLTEYNFDPEASLDILNNLLYSHLVWRDTTAQQYLANALLDLEQHLESEAPGLTELRVAQAKIEIGAFEEGLKFSIAAFDEASLPRLATQAKIIEATSLAGLGRLSDAQSIITEYEFDLSAKHLLTTKSSDSIMQLAFLMALKSGDEDLSITLSNRRLQLLSQNFLAEAASDTSSVLASLENSRERQEERAAAAAREAALLELTIVKQRRVNRMLMALLGLSALVLIGLLAFLKFRERTMKELAIKRKEAASADKLKTDFLGMISHELRTPLNGIIGFADLLAQTHADADVRKKTSVILQSGHELLDVVESMTDMARIDAGQMNIVPENTDILDLLMEVVEPLQPTAEQKGLAFTKHIDPDLGEHVVDGQRLQQCVRTVLSNAVSFTNSGRVHMHATAQKDDMGNVCGATIVIADTGVGMTELVQSRLFTPFMQADTSLRRSHMGTGLSLAIAKALIDMMGGTLTVISRQDRGSEFTLSVPLATAKNEALETFEPDNIKETLSSLPPSVLDLMQPRAGQNSAPLHATPPSVQTENGLDGLRVLIVDDLKTNRDIVRDMLEPQNCICFDAPDGEDALEALQAGPFDVVIMDIHMNRLDGVEATRRIRESRAAFSDIPIIALTADNAATTNAACMAAGVDIFLTKPVRGADLCRALEFLQTGSSRRTLRQAEGG